LDSVSDFVRICCGFGCICSDSGLMVMCFVVVSLVWFDDDDDDATPN